MPDDIIKPNQSSPSNEPDSGEKLNLDTEETDTSDIDLSNSLKLGQEGTETTSSSTPDPVISPVGAPGASFQPQSPVNTSGTPTPQPQFNEPQKHGPKLWLILILILLVIGGSVAAALYITKSDDTQATTPASAKKDIPHISYALPDGDLSQFYPLGNTATSVQLNSQIYEGLVRYEQQTKIVPMLATKWSNPDTSTWVFTLRKDVKFHSGRTMTAKDVKFSLDYAATHQEDEGTNLIIASSIKQVDIVSDYQVKVTTDGPDPILLNRLAFLYIMDSQSKVGDPNGGTGAYIVKPNTTPTPTKIDLAASNNYYGGHIYTKALTIEIVPDSNVMIKGINDGKYDIAGSLETDQLTKVKNYEPIKGQNFSIGFLGLNTLRTDSPLSNIKGRQAAAYALDLPKILKAGKLDGEPTTQLVPPKIPGYDAGIKGTSYDPEKAKALLREVPNAAAPLTIGFVNDDNRPHMTEIANELNAVGFNATLKEQPDIDTLINEGFSGETDMLYIVYDSPTLDGYDVFSTILQGNNIYHNDELDKQIDESISTFDSSDRLAILKKISREVAQDLPVIPIYTPIDTYALRKPYYIQTDIPSGQASIYFWQTYQK